MKQISIEILSKKVKEQRGERTQVDIEALTGINRQIIGRIEKGKYIPSLPQLNLILEKLDINFEEITETKKKSIFADMMGEAKTEAEKEGFEKMVSMMLCLIKYDSLRGINNV